jgi:uncharacterized membrane protein
MISRLTETDNSVSRCVQRYSQKGSFYHFRDRIGMPAASISIVQMATHGPLLHTMGGYGGGFVWLIVLILVGVGIYFLLRVFKSKGSDGSIIETPSDSLKKRYAKCEIDKEEFERKKKDLTS